MSEDAVALFGAKPMPQYLIARGGLSVFIICVHIEISSWTRNAAWLKPSHYTGELSLTPYVTSTPLSVWVPWKRLGINKQSIESALSSALMFCVAAKLFACR